MRIAVAVIATCVVFGAGVLIGGRAEPALARAPAESSRVLKELRNLRAHLERQDDRLAAIEARMAGTVEVKQVEQSGTPTQALPAYDVLQERALGEVKKRWDKARAIAEQNPNIALVAQSLEGLYNRARSARDATDLRKAIGDTLWKATLAGLE